MSFTRLILIIAFIFAGFSLYKHISSERIVKDFNTYKGSVQQAVSHFDNGALNLQTLLLSRPPTMDLFMSEYETKVVQEFEKGAQILRTAEPKTKDIQEYKTIIVTHTDRSVQIIREIGEATKQNDINRMKSLTEEFRNSSAQMKQGMTQKEAELSEKYNITIESNLR